MRTIGVMAVVALFGVTCAVAQDAQRKLLQAKDSDMADYADGFSGGPDYWDVANLVNGQTLNVRSEPGAGKQIVGSLLIGERVRNLGCKPVGSSRWCQIESGPKQKLTGWVNGKYLREAADSPQVATSSSDATGSLPCATALGQPSSDCSFRVTRGLAGNADVWIELPTGEERYIQFREGKPIVTDPGLALIFERTGDLTLIRIGSIERYEIPDALIFGG
ncbi:SH3 domain-containing protein [Pseudomonas sp. D4002]|uniref:SH3 domain-containing protein n=1 Tax=Pseudomonas sp. D4002 TaxID=2738817 RepID=UPI00159FB7BF|nr:SH3 domain-containing protein [Pseudomonas sp. D4002]NWB24152.1 SH3 domain-containing protein [Pseudomonas sp. D4002]